MPPVTRPLTVPTARTPQSTLDPQTLPFWSTTDGTTARLYWGDVVQCLHLLPSNSIHCVITSPPYWALRDYNVDGQLGSEPTPQAFVQKMVEVFREVRRVLRPDGTLWLNLGDTYGGGKSNGGVFESGRTDGRSGDGGRQRWLDGHTEDIECSTTLAPGNLVGIPWRVALALQADGWILRQDIIWHKPSPMPESVSNRCTKAHEYVFLFTKTQWYYYDAEAIREEAFGGVLERTRNNGFRNKRSVWTIASQPFAGAHFATFPPNLIEPMILAGTSAEGCCVKCGAPWVRVLEKTKLTRERPNDYVKRTGEEGTGNSCANTVAGVDTKTLRWDPQCRCGEVYGSKPCTVLDPFVGSGTTVAVACQNGRSGVGIDLNKDYLTRFAVKRIEGVLLGKPSTAHLVPRPIPKKVMPPRKGK